LEIEYLNKTYNLNLPESESYDTLGGLIVFNKEEIPKTGDKILIDNYSIEILYATSSKIEKVVLKKIDEE
jgi:CBS domain containing-hemolysin-like protein